MGRALEKFCRPTPFPIAGIFRGKSYCKISQPGKCLKIMEKLQEVKNVAGFEGRPKWFLKGRLCLLEYWQEDPLLGFSGTFRFKVNWDNGTKTVTLSK